MHVVLLAHGSRDPRHAAMIGSIASRVAVRAPGTSVGVAYLDHCAPALTDEVEGLPRSGRVVVVPMLLTAAFHAGTDVPYAVRAAAARRPDLAFTTSDVLGPSNLLVDALAERVAAAGADPDDPDTAVLLLAAGSSQQSARDAVRDVADSWLKPPRRGAYAFASGPGPQVPETVRALAEDGAHTIVVAPYLLAPGALADGAAEQARQAGAEADVAVVVADVLGGSEAVVSLVLGRVESVAS